MHIVVSCLFLISYYKFNLLFLQGNFFANFGTILIFAVFGTLISACVVGGGIYLLGVVRTRQYSWCCHL